MILDPLVHLLQNNHSVELRAYVKCFVRVLRDVVAYDWPMTL